MADNEGPVHSPQKIKKVDPIWLTKNPPRSETTLGTSEFLLKIAEILNRMRSAHINSIVNINSIFSKIEKINVRIEKMEKKLDAPTSTNATQVDSTLSSETSHTNSSPSQHQTTTIHGSPLVLKWHLR